METKGDQSFVVHSVEAGETIFSLSRRYGSTVAEIKSSNDLSDNNLSIDQLLSIPVVITEIPVEEEQTPATAILHTVKNGETLYGISRQYNISVSQIKLLNDMTGNDLSVGSQLIVGEKVDREVDSDIEVVETEVVESDTIDNVHYVEAGETIYSIARKYGVEVQELRSVNDLSSNNISIGQALTLPFAVAGEEPEQEIQEMDSTVVDAAVSTAVSTNAASSDSTVLESNVEEAQDSTGLVNVGVKEVAVLLDTAKATQTEEVAITEPVRYGNSDKRDTTNIVSGQVVEEGFAMKIENAPSTRKYLALHRTVPIGTIMQVKNQMNNQSIFVRVVGKLPDTGPNKNVLIRLTRQAFERLGAIDPKIPVEVAYMSE
ncbi:MAG: LysM peptidoglycan-binding domain-containing protein [Bacteroidota bacterium]